MPLRPFLVASALLVSALAPLASTSWANSSIDGIEHLFGASNVHAITGHGRLTVGVSRDGDLTVLVWPNPSLADQLGYISSNALDARDQPRFGAPEGAGVFLGLRLDLTGGASVVTWLRDASTWTASQSYGASDGPNIETVFASEDLGLTLTLTDAVAPDADLLVRSVRLERSPSSEVDEAWLLTYANLSPLPPNSRLVQLPIADWGLDGRDDFAAVWDPEAGLVLHFHPGDRRIVDDLVDVLAPGEVDFGPIGAALASGEVDDEALAGLVAELDEVFAPGAYLALTTRPPPDQHQVGFDVTPFCDVVDLIIANLQSVGDSLGLDLPIDPNLLENLRCTPAWLVTPEGEGWTAIAQDALADAADGELSGAGLAAGEVNVALRTPLLFEFAGGGVAEAAVLLGVGPEAASARAALAAGSDPAVVLARAEAALSTWLAGRRLPSNDSPLVEQVARRSLINIRVGTVAENGAIVASITRQPPYGLDWPRDGAFFNVALDASGQTELATQRVDLYAEWQRTEPGEPTLFIDVEPPVDPDTGSAATYPAGAWEMNYYADGAMGGTFRFEIDNTAFALWTMVAHVGWLREAEREAYLLARWDTIARAANLLARWRDPETGLPAPAQEDDRADYTQTLHGAVTTFGALDLAARAARLVGRDDDAGRWEARAGELRDAILVELYDVERRRFVTDASSGNPGSAPMGPTAWLVWPARLLDWDDPRTTAQLAFDLDAIAPTVELENDGGAYVMKNTLSAALAIEEGDPDRLRVRAMLEALAAQATEGTHHFGEVMVVVQDGEGNPVADQRVSTPHLWEGALFYLTALALEEPEALLRYEQALPESRVAPPAPAPWLDAGDGAGDGGDASEVGEPADAGEPEPRGGEDGCGCGASPGAGWGSAWWLLAVVGLASRRARSASPRRGGGRLWAWLSQRD